MNEKSIYWDDFLNPVLIKEIRQFFHNRLFISLVAGLLGVQLVVLFIFNLSFSEWKDGSDAGTVFIVIDTILMYLCVLCTAVWGSMQRFSQERSSKELDFTNITLLSPWQIVTGKLASALVIWGLTAALCLPFMAIAYFFRNVTFENILVIFGAGVVPTLILVQGALLCGAFGKKWLYGVFVYFGFQTIIPMAIFSVTAFFEIGRASTAAWTVFWTVQAGGVALFVLLLASTVALITPPYANRMLPLRILLAGMMLAVLAALPFVQSSRKEVLMLFSLFPLGLMCFFALLAACDRDIPGGRVLAQVPRNQAGRFLHYLFSSNRTGGMLLSLIVLLILAAVLAVTGIFKSENYGVIALGMAGYILFYTEIGILLSRKVPSIPGWAWTLIVGIGLGVLPLISAASRNVEMSEIIISPFSLLYQTGNKYTVWAPAFWIAPAAAWLLGLVFVVDWLKKYKFYKSPELPEKSQASEEKKEELS